MKRLGIWMTFAVLLTASAAEMEVTGSKVNVRQAPSTKAAIVGSVKAGARVQVKQVKNGWAELETPAGFMSATYLKTPAAAPEAAKTAKPAAKPATGQPFTDLPVVPGSARDVTVKGRLAPTKSAGRIRYALVREIKAKYEIDCFVYVPDAEKGKFKPFVDQDVQLVGTWYRVSGWKNPVLKVRRIKPLNTGVNP